MSDQPHLDADTSTRMDQLRACFNDPNTIAPLSDCVEQKACSLNLIRVPFEEIEVLCHMCFANFRIDDSGSSLRTRMR